MNGLLTHSNLSVASFWSSALSLRTTTTTATTFRGLGSSGGKLVMAVGEAARRTIDEMLFIPSRLNAIGKCFPHKDSDAEDLGAVYEDVLELARHLFLLYFYFMQHLTSL